MADNPQLSAIAKWSVDEFAKGFGLAIEGMAGTPPGVSFEMLDAAPEPAVPLLGWSQPFNGLPGEALVMTPEPDVLALGQHVMQAAGVDDCSQEDLKSTFLECLGQAFSLLARAMTARLQREVTPAAGSEAQAAAANLTWGSVRLTLEERTASVFLGLPANLLEAFLAEPQTAPQTAPQEVAQAAAAGASSSPNPAPTQIAPTTRAPAEHSKTFDLLLDVELSKHPVVTTSAKPAKKLKPLVQPWLKSTRWPTSKMYHPPKQLIPWLNVAFAAPASVLPAPVK
jgi:hypothetical protein